MNIKAMFAVVGIGFGGTVLALAAAKRDEPVKAAVTAAAEITPEGVADQKDEAAPQPAQPEVIKVAAQADPVKKAEAPPAPPIDQEPRISPKQLDAILAPIALYPDQLLQQILMASTYPLEVIEAARWASRPENENLKGDALTAALEEQDWDPSVKALAAFPQILKMMDTDVAWLGKLGDAFLAQQADVMDSVQRLRREARNADQLQSDVRRQVTMEDDQIIIAPANPDVVYVPFYNPTEVYGAWPYPDYPPAYIPPPAGFAYSPGIYYNFVSVNRFWGWSQWDWRHRRIRIIDPPRYTDHNHGRGPVDPGVWRHDPDRGHGRGRGDWSDDRNNWRNRPQPGVNPGPPVVINNPNPRHPPGGPGSMDAPPAQRMTPRDRVYRPEPGQLPDLSPPLPATATLPALPPATTNPNIGVQPPRGDDQAEAFRRRRQEDDDRRDQQAREREDNIRRLQEQERRNQEARENDARRQQQFQDRSITAPALSNVPPTQQQRWGMRDPSINAPPVTNVPPRAPQPPPVQYQRAMPAPEAAPAPAYQPPIPSVPPPQPAYQRPMPAAVTPAAPAIAPQPAPAQAVAPPQAAPAQAPVSRFGNRGYTADNPPPTGRQPGCGPYGCPNK